MTSQLHRSALAIAFAFGALSAQAPQWLCVDGPVQSKRGAAFDTHRGRLVAFGSDGGTWEWDGTQWFLRPTNVAPPRRIGPAMVYDPVRRHTLLFGGLAAGVLQTRMSDTWAWDGTTWTPAGGVIVPPGGTDLPIAFDEVRGRVVMFSGTNTFEHDGTQWLQFTPAVTPGSTQRGAMTFDPVRGVCLLFAWSQLWQWDGTNWTWLSNAPPNSSTPTYNIAFDRARQRLVVFGVEAAWTTTFEWDGTNWFQLPSTNLARSRSAMYFDPRRQQVVLHSGGDDRFFSFSDQWAWNGTAWSLIAPESRPFARIETVFAHDPARGMTLLFGGGTFNSGNTWQDTWEWDGHRWHLRTPAAQPMSRSRASMCMDPGSGRLTLFGGWNYPSAINDMWNWDGTNWTSMAPAVRPSARAWHAMASDTGRNRIVLFGGHDGTQLLNDTWEWNGSNWTLAATPLAPPARTQHAMAFDAVRSRTIAVGGTVDHWTGVWMDDTWAWDGTVWQQVAANAPPSRLERPSAVFDPLAGKVLLAGTVNAPIAVFENWQFDGAAWTRLQVQGPRPGSDPRLAWDARRGRAVMFDGSMVLELTATPASVTAYGSGCGAPAPVLAARARPRTGEPAFGLEMAVQPGQPVLFALAAAAGSTALGNGCTLLLQQPMATAFTVADTFGMAVLPVSLPANQALRGLAVFSQAAVLSPASPMGIALSQGQRLDVGD